MLKVGKRRRGLQILDTRTGIARSLIDVVNDSVSPRVEKRTFLE